MSNNIKVVCRFRPQNSLEIKEGGTPIIDIDDDGTQIGLKVTTNNKKIKWGNTNILVYFLKKREMISKVVLLLIKFLE
jgi:hypothetical protein